MQELPFEAQLLSSPSVNSPISRSKERAEIFKTASELIKPGGELDRLKAEIEQIETGIENAFSASYDSGPTFARLHALLESLSALSNTLAGGLGALQVGDTSNFDLSSQRLKGEVDEAWKKANKVQEGASIVVDILGSNKK